MAYQIVVQGNNLPTEHAAVVTAFNSLITALETGTSFNVDAGGTLIDGTAFTADDAVVADQHLPQGTVW